MMDDSATELVKPNPHIFTEINPRHPDWWRLINSGYKTFNLRLYKLFSDCPSQYNNIQFKIMTLQL